MSDIFISGDFSKYAKYADLASARGPIKDILDKAKEVARRIHEKYEDDKKEPTGNQNCLLCSWCAEAMLRGNDILPRPVYSPRDPALVITPEDMLKGSVEKRYFKNFSDMQNWYLDLKNARFYVHVKCSKGNGSHEFLLLNTNVPHVLDAQRGLLSPVVDMKTFKEYFGDIDYNETYMCRIDNHDLDIENLKQINNESAIVAWDEEKDNQYMRDHDMMSDEENYTMRDATESDLEFVYQSELETVGENKDDPKVQRYIRKDAKESLGHTKIIVVDEKDAGVYQAYATNYYGLREGKRDWWYLAHIYLKPEYRSKGIGSSIIKKDMSEHDKILLQVMKSNPKAKKLYESLGFKFSQENDHGGIIMRYEKDEVVTESFIDGKTMFHVSPKSYLDGQVFKPRVPEYIDRYDPDDTGFENSTTPRVCVSPSIEGCFNAIVCKFIPSHPVPMDKMYVYTPEKPFREYKHKTNKELIRDKEVYDANLTKEAWILEPVRMRLYGVIQLDQVKKVKRKKTIPTKSGKSEQRDYFDIKYHWVIPPKVAKTNTAKYDAMSVCKNLASELAPYKYGLIKDGKLSTHDNSEKDWDKWRLSSIEEFEKAGGGNCYDFTEWEAGYLDAYGVKFNKYFISATYKNKYSTHTFVVVPDGRRFIYIERAFERIYNEIDGMKVFDKLDDIFNYILETMCEFENVPEFNYLINEYSDATPRVGTPMKQFQEYIVTNGKEVSSGTFKPRKD